MRSAWPKRRRNHERTTWAFYVAKFAESVYVLHAFEKRTRRTRKADIELANKRLADAKALRKHL